MNNNEILLLKLGEVVLKGLNRRRASSGGGHCSPAYPQSCGG